MREYNYDELMSSANELVDKVKEAYDNGDMASANQNWNKIFDLIVPEGADNMEERYSFLNEVMENFNDQEVYDITNYGKEQSYARVENELTNDELIYEDDMIKITETGRDYDFVATIENKTDEEIIVIVDGDYEFARIEPDDWVGLTNTEYDELNEWLSLDSMEVKTADELKEERGYDRDDYDYDR